MQSLAKQLSHLRGLLEYAWRSGRSERNVLDGFNLQDDQPRTAPPVLTVEQAQRLVRQCPSRNAAERRDRLIILLLYGCGLRTMELCALDVGDICRERQELTVQKGKGDRPRVVPIPDGVYTELLAYLLEHGKRGALFRTLARATRLRRRSGRQHRARRRACARVSAGKSPPAPCATASPPT